MNHAQAVTEGKVYLVVQRIYRVPSGPRYPRYSDYWDGHGSLSCGPCFEVMFEALYTGVN